jgi:hypothetical protein
MFEDCYTDFVNDSTPKIRPSPRRPRVTVPQVPGAYKNTVCPFVPLKLAPIEHIDEYIRDMKMTDEEEKKCRELYTPPPPFEVEKMSKPHVPSDPLTVFTQMKVLKNGLIRVKITVPMEPVHEYAKKGKVAPLDVRIKAAKNFGYDEDTLTKIIQNNDTKKTKNAKLDEFIDGIFGKCINAKTNKPKKKTIQESLNSKFKKKPAKKYS